MLDSLPLLAAGAARLRRLVADAGRDPSAVGVGYRVKRVGAGVQPKASDGGRRLFSGADADVLDDVRAMREAGVSVIDVDVERPDPDATIAEMRRLRELLARV
jgi:hypothetical protein